MAASINNGWVNFRASNFMANHTNKIAANVTRLSGNTKFASGADNPAGFAFAQRTRSSALAVAQVTENIQNTQTQLKIADSAYGSILDILSQAKDIAAQASAYGDGDSEKFAKNANSAIAALYGQISSISDAATFNGTAVIGTAIKTEIGGDKTKTLSLAALTKVTEKAPSITDQSTAAKAVATIQASIEKVLGYQSTAGADASALGYLNDFVNSKAAYMQEAANNAGNVDITKEMSDYVSNQIALQSAQFIAAQQNQNAYSVLNLLK